MTKTKEQLENSIEVDKKLKEERDESDRLYAIKRVEHVVFGMLAILASAFLYKLIAIAFQEYVK